jgi:glutaconate CoA-transferase subunit A
MVIEKQMDLRQAVSLINDGDRVAVGGRMQMAPMALIREMIRQGKKNLQLVTIPGGAIGVDMLIGAGAALSIETAQVVMDEYGQAPNFRRAVEQGRIKVLDHS